MPQFWLNLPPTAYPNRILSERRIGLIPVIFEEVNITGEGGAESPHLVIPLGLGGPASEGLEILASALEVNLYLGWVKPANSLPISRATYILQPGTFENSYPILKIRLDQRTLERIEENRNGQEAQFTLSLDAAITVRTIKDGVVKDIDCVSGSAEFRIPRSIWTDTVLPNLGYLTTYLIEVPAPRAEDLHPNFQKAIKELKDAEAAFRNDNYEQVLTDCRNAINAAASAFKLDLSGEQAEYKVRVRAFREQQLEPRVGGTKSELIADELNALWRPLSAPTKPGSFNGDRPFAKHVLVGTANILAYLGTVFSNT